MLKTIIKDIKKSIDYRDKTDNTIKKKIINYYNKYSDLPHDIYDYIYFIKSFDIIIDNEDKIEIDETLIDNKLSRVIFFIKIDNNLNFKLEEILKWNLIKIHNTYKKIISYKYDKSHNGNIFEELYHKDSTLDTAYYDLKYLDKKYNISENIDQIKLYYHYKDILTNIETTLCITEY